MTGLNLSCVHLVQMCYKQCGLIDHNVGENVNIICLFISFTSRLTASYIKSPIFILLYVTDCMVQIAIIMNSF